MSKTGIDTELLPAWFTERMTEDQWHFGLLTVTGHLFYIETINSIRQDASGELWLDVELWKKDDVVPVTVPGVTPFYSPTERTSATIKASHVVAAFELAAS